MQPDEWLNNESGGGRFSEARPKEYLDWIKYYAEQLPAPGDYELPDQHKKGGKFSNAKPKDVRTFIDSLPPLMYTYMSPAPATRYFLFLLFLLFHSFRMWNGPFTVLNRNPVQDNTI